MQLEELLRQRADAGNEPIEGGDTYIANRLSTAEANQRAAFVMELTDGRAIAVRHQPLGRRHPAAVGPQIQPQLRAILEMIRTDDKEYPPQGAHTLGRLDGTIAFDNVSFGYDPQALVLEDVSFEIPAGVTTALIGASGAGKTTIVNLLLRLYEPLAGEIRIGGTRLTDTKRGDWLSRIAVTGQDVDLVEGSVIDNIRMAKTGASEAEIIAAAHSAGAASFVANLPEGYDTWIGQEGTRFSGGQRQRIGLARAILRDPDFLILDEAMNALDTALESQVRRSIDRDLGGRTILVITHRIDAVRDAAQVVWIENGRVRSQGPASLVLSQYQRSGAKQEIVPAEKLRGYARIAIPQKARTIPGDRGLNDPVDRRL